jgi:hypothetical protein
MTIATKRIHLIFLLIALFALILLSASLSNLELVPGAPFPGASNSEGARFIEKVWPQLATYPSPFLEGLMALVFSSLLIYIFVRLIKIVNLRDILRPVLILMILLLAMILLPRTPINPVATEPGTYTEIATPTPKTYIVTPLGAPPPILIWLTGIILILGLSIPIIGIMRQRLRSVVSDDPILREAEIAVAALLDGQNFSDVILRCYFEMTNAIQLEHGISREKNLTVREFEQQLDEQGFPSQPVQNLTALFEKARYGIEMIRDEDHDLALESLGAIIRYCKKGRISTNETTQ